MNLKEFVDEKFRKPIRKVENQNQKKFIDCGHDEGYIKAHFGDIIRESIYAREGIPYCGLSESPFAFMSEYEKIIKDIELTEEQIETISDFIKLIIHVQEQIKRELRQQEYDSHIKKFGN